MKKNGKWIIISWVFPFFWYLQVERIFIFQFDQFHVDVILAKTVLPWAMHSLFIFLRKKWVILNSINFLIFEWYFCYWNVTTIFRIHLIPKLEESGLYHLLIKKKKACFWTWDLTQTTFILKVGTHWQAPKTRSHERKGAREPSADGLRARTHWRAKPFASGSWTVPLVNVYAP